MPLGSDTNKSRRSPLKIIDSRQVFTAAPWFSISGQQMRLPNGTVAPDFHQIKLSEFVVVYAQTTDGRVIVERQYQHGVGKVTLTLPAGLVEHGEQPLAAAQRELEEETGYRADSWRSLGSFYNHDSYGCGKGHLFQATGARRVAEPHSEDLEETEVILMDSSQIVDAVRQGQIELLGSLATIALVNNPLFSAITVNPAGFGEETTLAWQRDESRRVI